MNRRTRYIIRNDLLDRIKEKHDLWFTDSTELYKMADLRPHELVHDALGVMTFQIAWMLNHYNIESETFFDTLRQVMAQLKKLHQQ